MTRRLFSLRVKASTGFVTEAESATNSIRRSLPKAKVKYPSEKKINKNVQECAECNSLEKDVREVGLEDYIVINKPRKLNAKLAI
jgi:hypothetical protein